MRSQYAFWRVFCSTKGVRFNLPAIFFLIIMGRLEGGPLPLTAKEVSLMLRSGYSNEAVAQDLATKHFAGPCDEATKKLLIDAGASQGLVTAIANGTYAIPATEVGRVQEEAAAQARRRALEAEQSRKFDTLYQSQMAQARSI